jgi:hypothetical protein
MPETTPNDTTLRVWLKPALLGLTLGVALAATPSMAQSSLEQRVERMEERLNGSALMGLMNQADTLRSEVTTLRGEIEVLQRQIDDLRDQQRQIYLDLDERLLSLEANPGNGDAISSETPTLRRTNPLMTRTARHPMAAIALPARVIKRAMKGQQFEPLTKQPSMNFGRASTPRLPQRLSNFSLITPTPT